jgi:hypothetical protein
MIMGRLTMVRCHGADREISERLSKKYAIPVLVATMAQVDAFRALGMKKLVGITYFQDDMNHRFAKFFEDDGFEVKAMKGIEVPFKDAGKLSPEAIYGFAKKIFLEHGPADGIYMLGAGCIHFRSSRCLRNLRTTVVSSIPAQVWATRRSSTERAGDGLRTPALRCHRWSDGDETVWTADPGSAFGVLAGAFGASSGSKDRAEAEGKLMFYAAFNANDSKTLTDGFKQLYPKIDAVFYRATDAQLMERILTESRAGQNLWDVVMTTSFDGHNLKKRGVLAIYDSPERKYYRDGYKDPQATWTSIYTNYAAFGYNTRSVAKTAVPKSFAICSSPVGKTSAWIAGLRVVRHDDQSDGEKGG